MKSFKIAISTVIIIIFSVDALGNDSALTEYKPSRSYWLIDSTDDKYFIIVTGGLGMTTGSANTNWESQFSLGPVSAIGIEIPFSSGHYFALQCYLHSWLGKSVKYTNPYSDRREYIKISENYYSSWGLSSFLKYYIGTKRTKLRMSFFIGAQFLSIDPDHTGLDFGFDFLYNINKECSLSLMRKINLGMPDLGGGLKDAPILLMLYFLGGSKKDIPNILMINFNYKIKW